MARLPIAPPLTLPPASRAGRRRALSSSTCTARLMAQSRRRPCKRSCRVRESRETMLHIDDEQKTITSDASELSTGAEKMPTVVSPVISRRGWPRRLWRAVKRYPIPLGSVALMGASLVFWLAGHGAIAGWILLAVALLGGLPLLWETVQQFLHKEFGVRSEE